MAQGRLVPVGVLQGSGHPGGALLRQGGLGPEIGGGGVALGGQGQVDGGLGQVVLPFRQPHPGEGLGGRGHLHQGVGVGQADVLRGQDSAGAA